MSLSSCSGLIPISDIEDDIYTNSSDFSRTPIIKDNAAFAQEKDIPNPDELEYDYYNENDAHKINNNYWGSSIIYDPFFGTYSTCIGFGYRYGMGYNYYDPFYSGFGNPYFYGNNYYNAYNPYNSYNSYWGNTWYNNRFPVVINNFNQSETKKVHYQPRNSRTGYSARGITTNSYNRRKSTNSSSSSTLKTESLNTLNKNSISKNPNRSGNNNVSSGVNTRSYSKPNRSNSNGSPNIKPSHRNSNTTNRSPSFSSPSARPSTGSSGKTNSGSNRDSSSSPNSRRR